MWRIHLSHIVQVFPDLKDQDFGSPHSMEISRKLITTSFFRLKQETIKSLRAAGFAVVQLWPQRNPIGLSKTLQSDVCDVRLFSVLDLIEFVDREITDFS